MGEDVIWRNPRKRKIDVEALFFKVSIAILSLVCFYGSFWWYDTNLTPFIGLTLAEVLEMPLLNILYAVASFWVIPAFFFMGIAGLLFLGVLIFD